MDDEEFSYRASRRRFLHAAAAAGATRIGTPPLALRGPAGETLATDVVRLGRADAPRVLLLLSGTHGVEGHCGSMIQTALLQAGLFNDLGAGVAVILVHAVNPHGFAWARRVTEEGVDLNRNFIDFAQPPPPNPHFTPALASWLVQGADQPHRQAWRRQTLLGLKVLLWRLRRGGAQATAAVAGGQYHHPQAPFFGGTAATAARLRLEGIVRQHLAPRRLVGVIDYHTGLGAGGTSQLIASSGLAPAHLDRGARVWGKQLVAIATPQSVAYRISGDLVCGIANLLGDSAFFGAAQEFGTQREMTVLQALRADHALHASADPHRILAATTTRRRMRQAFFSNNRQWQARVLESAKTTAAVALDYLRSEAGDR